jgi:hypothetical protein
MAPLRQIVGMVSSNVLKPRRMLVLTAEVRARLQGSYTELHFYPPQKPVWRAT